MEFYVFRKGKEICVKRKSFKSNSSCYSLKSSVSTVNEIINTHLNFKNAKNTLSIVFPSITYSLT